jgi:excisionase family DNA binding protein
MEYLMSSENRRALEEIANRIAVRRQEAANLLDVSASTFDEWVRRGLMPKGIKIGGLRRWDAAEVKASWQDLVEQNRDPEEDDGTNPFDETIG